VREIKDYKIIIALIVLQLLVTLPFISSAPISIDEPFSIFYAQQDLNDMMSFLNLGNNPPLHFIVLHYWVELFGIGSISVRSLSLVFSLLTIPVLYKFSRKIFNANYSIIIVSFFIFSTFNHFHALEARVYSLMVLLVVLIFYEIYKLVFNDGFSFFKLAIWNALLMYSHYLGAITIGVELLILSVFYYKLTKKSISYFFLSGVISIILFAPGLLVFFVRVKDFSNNGTWVSPPQLGELYGNVVRFLNGKPSVLIMICLFVIVIIFNRKAILKNRFKELFFEKNVFLFLIFVVPYSGMYVFSIIQQPVFIDRYLLFVTPFLFMSIIAFFKFLLIGIEKWYFQICIVLPMVIFCVYVPEVNRDPDEISKFIIESKGNESDLLICPPYYDLTFLYHYNKEGFEKFRNKEKVKSRLNIYPVYSLENSNINNYKNEIFFIDANSEILYPNNNILRNLKLNYKLVVQKEFKGGYMVYQFIK
jgi:uncharacterized membrane protein